MYPTIDQARDAIQGRDEFREAGMGTPLPIDYPLFCPVSGVRLVHSASSLNTADRNKALYELVYIQGLRPGKVDEGGSSVAMSRGLAYHGIMEEVVKCRQLDGKWAEAADLAQVLALERQGAFPGLPEALTGWFDHWQGAYPEPIPGIPPEALFWYPLPREAPCGLPYVLFGIMDWPATLGTGAYSSANPLRCIVERKTTGRAPSASYWSQHRWSWQARIYALAAWELLKTRNILLDVVRWPGDAWLAASEEKRAKLSGPAYYREMFTYSRMDLDDLVTNTLALLVELELAQQEGVYRNAYWGYDNSLGQYWESTLAVPAKYRKEGLEQVELVHPVVRQMGEG